ncbi:MAG: hypothetical protein SFU87_09300 [Chitinophagaceae bacterium]|nr:hypothetical protein [Chitinophagaceae bacterium]
MSTTAIKSKIIREMQEMKPEQLRELYNAVKMMKLTDRFFSGKRKMPPDLEAKINRGIEQADKGEVIPFDEAIQQIRKKHKLNA